MNFQRTAKPILTGLTLLGMIAIPHAYGQTEPMQGMDGKQMQGMDHSRMQGMEPATPQQSRTPARRGSTTATTRRGLPRGRFDRSKTCKRMATVLAGMLEGIERGLEPSEPITGNGYEQIAPSLPRFWPDALRRARGSEFLRRRLGERFTDVFLTVKEAASLNKNDRIVEGGFLF